MTKDKGYLLHDYRGEIEVEEIEILSRWGSGDDEQFVVKKTGKAIWTSAYGGRVLPGLKSDGFATTFVQMMNRTCPKDNFAPLDRVFLTMDEIKEAILELAPDVMRDLKRRESQNTFYQDALNNLDLSTLPKDTYISPISGRCV